jgi:hypothetical protein
MNKILTFGVAVVIGMMLACGNAVSGSGNIITENRTVSNFDKISLEGSGQLTLIQGETESLTIVAEDNILPLLESEVRDRTLYLGTKENSSFITTEPIRYTVTMIDISGLSVAGSADIVAAVVDAVNLVIDVSGSGEINIGQLTADTLTASISGSANMVIAGEIDSQDVTVSGSGDYEAGELDSNGADVTVDGSGKAVVWVNQSLTANVSGSGNIEYFGTPDTVIENIDGSGEIVSQGGR